MSHKTRSDQFGISELPRERFIYLAASANNRVCKVGVSIHPDRRMRALPNGTRLFYRDPSFDPKRPDPPILLRQWSLGMVSKRAAYAIERGIHLTLRGIARRHVSEFYLMAPSVAAEYIDSLLGKAA